MIITFYKILVGSTNNESNSENKGLNVNNYKMKISKREILSLIVVLKICIIFKRSVNAAPKTC